MCPGQLYFFEGERRIYMIRNTAHFILFAPHQGAERRSLRTLVQNPMNYGKVRIADIVVHCSEGPLCSLSFESERYGPHAYHRDDIAF